MKTSLFGLLLLITGLTSSAVNDDCGKELIDAVNKSDFELTKQLLEQGCDPNTLVEFRPSIYFSALYMAVNRGNIEIIELLLKYKADPNLYKTNTLSLSPLQFSTGSNSLEILKLLLNNGGDLSKINRQSEYPVVLSYPTRFGHLDMVKFLFENYQTVIKQEDAIQYSLADTALKYGVFDVAEYLIENKMAFGGDSVYNMELLKAALSYSQYEIAKAILDKIGDVNVRFSFASEDCIICNNDITPLHDAVSKRNLSFIKWLITQGADLNAESSEGDTPLGRAAFLGYYDVVDELLENGAKLETASCPALHYGALFSNYQMVAYLLKKGANPNSYNNRNNRNTPILTSYLCCGDGLQDAIKEEDRVKTIELLLDNGANPSIKNDQGESLIGLCKQEFVRKEVYEVMVKRRLINQ